jgi:hypothetical protein
MLFIAPFFNRNRAAINLADSRLVQIFSKNLFGSKKQTLWGILLKQ